MTPREILENNGDFSTAPLYAAARRLQKRLEEEGVTYAVVGGLAVVRNGAVRTTVDIDILVAEEEWTRLGENGLPDFRMEGDQAVDEATGITVDVLFPGDEWEMDIPVPGPAEVREWDEELGGWYIDLLHLLELKTAVYLKKRREDGEEIAAKDLADVVALTRNNLDRITAKDIEEMHPKIREQYRRIFEKLRKKENRER
jgi:hypothetical protein